VKGKFGRGIVAAVRGAQRVVFNEWLVVGNERLLLNDFSQMSRYLWAT
jgi:hypothetical protein